MIYRDSDYRFFLIKGNMKLICKKTEGIMKYSSDMITDYCGLTLSCISKRRLILKFDHS